MKQYLSFLLQWKRKLRFHLLFFFNTLWLSIPIGLAIAAISQIAKYGSFAESWYLAIPTGGLGIDLLYKEISRKNDYFFFYNLGIGKIDLWVSSFLLTLCSCLLLNKIIQLCVHVWKLIVS